MAQDDIMTVQEVAEYMKVSEKTVRNWVNSGELARIPIGRKEYRIRRQDLEDFMERRRQQGRSPTDDQ